MELPSGEIAYFACEPIHDQERSNAWGQYKDLTGRFSGSGAIYKALVFVKCVLCAAKTGFLCFQKAEKKCSIFVEQKVTSFVVMYMRPIKTYEKMYMFILHVM